MKANNAHDQVEADFYETSIFGKEKNDTSSLLATDSPTNVFRSFLCGAIMAQPPIQGRQEALTRTL